MLNAAIWEGDGDGVESVIWSGLRFREREVIGGKVRMRHFLKAGYRRRM